MRNILVVVSSLITSICAPQASALRGSTYARAGAVAFVWWPVACDNPLPNDCVAAEVAKRTVLVELAHGWCSGVLVSPRVIRSAGHCFADGDKIESVRRADGASFSAHYSVRFRFDGTDRPFFAYWDQAEIRADRDLAAVSILPLVNARAEAPNGVIATGFAGNAPLRRDGVLVAARLADVTGPGGPTTYLLANSLGWRARPGQSGGPVFRAEACTLALVGNISAVRGPWTIVQSAIPFPIIAATPPRRAGR